MQRDPIRSQSPVMQPIRSRVAAGLRTGHLPTPTVAFRIAAAGPLFDRHARTVSHARHRRCHKKQEQQQHSSELAQRLHTNSIPSPAPGEEIVEASSIFQAGERERHTARAAFPQANAAYPPIAARRSGSHAASSHAGPRRASLRPLTRPSGLRHCPRLRSPLPHVPAVPAAA